MNSTVNQKRNYIAFLIHALFLALTMSFIDVNTVIPNMMGEMGAKSIHLGILSSIMVGGTSVMQLLFAILIIPLKKKKPALLIAIYIRVGALLLLGLFLFFNISGESWVIWTLLFIMAMFSFGGAFANISYTDILGRAIQTEKRKEFLMRKQLISSIGVIVSALSVKIILTSLNYPKNYAFLFISGSFILLLATIGFWMIEEPINTSVQKEPISKRFRLLYKAVKEDRNVRKYLLFINTSGVILSTIPFLILFGRTQFTIDGSVIGTFLLVQMGGGLLTNISLHTFYKREEYRPLLYLFIIIASTTPIIALLCSSSSTAYMITFIFSGAAIELYKIVTPGILLEISTDENRTLYTGLAGAGSIMNIIYPIIAGLLITLIGYYIVFILTSLYIFCGFYFAKKIVCLRFTSQGPLQ
ncbi:MAG: MFS transporter [Spirochaetia bacterium]|nr:MFS transporter [Spirochaetia bacterium]